MLNKGKQPDSHIYIEYYQSGKTPEFEDFAPDHRGRVRNQMQLVRLGNLVGVRYDIKSQNDDFEIYDVVKDPQQSKNLAGTPEMAGIQDQMKDKSLQSRRPNATAPRPYDNELVPAEKTESLESGIQWKAYKGDFPWVPEVATLSPAATGTTDIPNGDIAKGKQYGALYYDGYIQVPEDGDYTFYLRTNATALFRVHDATVIDADYEYFQNTSMAGSIKLKAGLHPFRLYLKEDLKGKPNIDLEWSGPGTEREKVPASVFYQG